MVTMHNSDQRLRFLFVRAACLLAATIGMAVVIHLPGSGADGVSRALAQAATPTAAGPGMGQLGDANGDGRCTEVDSLQALKMAVGQAAQDPTRLDVNRDGKVSEVDALQILKWAVTGGQCAAGSMSPLGNPVQTEQEAIQIAEAAISSDFPDMVGAQRSVSEYSTVQGEYYDVLYKRTVQVESEGEVFDWLRMVMVTIDQRTGQHSVAESG